MWLDTLLAASLGCSAHAGTTQPAVPGFTVFPNMAVSEQNELLHFDEAGGQDVTLSGSWLACPFCALQSGFSALACSVSNIDEGTGGATSPYDFYIRTDIGDPCNPPRCICGNGLAESCPGFPRGQTSAADLALHAGGNIAGPGGLAEECDDGNREDGDLCTSACTVPFCTDGLSPCCYEPPSVPVNAVATS
eukprot:gene9395-8418_t